MTPAASGHGGPPSCLEASAPAIAGLWQTSPEAVRRAAQAGLLATCGSGFDAERALALAARPYAEVAASDLLPPDSILLVQQSPVRWHGPDDDDASWRPSYGWSAALTAEEALLSASGWWPLDPSRWSRLRGLVSTVSSFVVTLGVVDPHQPVHEEYGGKVRLHVTPATVETAVGVALRSAFAGRRVPVRRGSSFLIP